MSVNRRAHSPNGIFLAMRSTSPAMFAAVRRRLIQYFDVAEDAIVQKMGRSTASFYIPGEPDAYERDWFYEDADSLSAAAHPILLPAVLEDESGQALRKFVTELRRGVQGPAYALSPVSYLHHNARSDTIVAANDALGMGKLYYYSSPGMSMVASGVITAALGMDETPQQDDEFWDSYYVTGGGLNETTYIQGVSLAPPGSHITISVNGLTTRQETHFTDLILGARSAGDDTIAPISAAHRLLKTTAPYLGQDSRLRLSGGVDSRFAAAALVSLGINVRATTFVPPALEAEIAQELYERSENSFTWEELEANPSTVRQDGRTPQAPGPPSGTILERAHSWFQYLGGDHWSTPTRSDAPVRKITPSRLMVSGSHGDFTRAHYYTQRDLEHGSSAATLQRYLNSFTRYRAMLSVDLRSRGTQLVKNDLLDSLVNGITGYHALDFAYYNNRVRRQFPPVSPSVVLPMLTPEMLLSTFWRPPLEKIAATAVRRMTVNLVPAWSGVPYFHEAAVGQDPEVTNKVTIQRTYWETEPESFPGVLETALDATQFSGVTMQSAMREISELPEGRNRTNQTFEFIFWHHASVVVLNRILEIRRSHPAGS